MEYQVTATRRRPQRFEDLLGQDFVAATLQKSIEAGKIAHAYLFSGPRGCGKTSSARILAKALNCEKGTVATPCGTCTSCREITMGSSIDVIEIDGASNTSVNDVRQIKDEILFPPNISRYKIYIIDEVHMLSTSAFNALLKTIEEPPPYVIFIFATTELHKVPATIKSRCQHFHFKLVDVEVLKQALADAAAELHIEADDEALYWIAREATGSVRDCYTLFDQVAAFSDGHITFDKIQKTLGLTGSDSIAALLTACVKKDAAAALLTLDTILQNGVSTEQFTVDCTNYLRSLLFIQHGITKEALIGQSVERFPQEILQNWQAQQIERALYLFLQLFKDMKFSLNPRYELELAISRLAWLSDYVSPRELKEAFDAAQAMLTGGASIPAPVGQRTYPASGMPLQAQKNVNTARQFNADTGYQNTGGNASTISRSKSVQTIPTGEAAPPFPKTGGVFAAKTAGFPSTTAQEQKPATPIRTTSEVQPVKVPQTSQVETIQELKEVLIQQLQIEHAMLATVLSKTADWHKQDDRLCISVYTPYEAQQLQREKKFLSQKAAALYGQTLEIAIELIEKKAAPKISIPARVEMVLRNFKGTIIDIQKKNIEEEAEEGEE